MDPLVAGCIPFQSPVLARSVIQLSTSFGGFFATCGAMYSYLALSLWVALRLSALAAGFPVRIFIIQHDCRHGSVIRRTLAFTRAATNVQRALRALRYNLWDASAVCRQISGD